MRLTEFLRDIGRPVVFYPSLNAIVGGMAANVLLNQLLYWHDKGLDPEGWIYKSRIEILGETGLSRDSQESARRELRLRGFLQEKFGDMPRRLLFRLNLDAINEAWEEAIFQHKVEIHPTEEGACLQHKVDNPPSIRWKSTQHAGGKSTSRHNVSRARSEASESTTEIKDTDFPQTPENPESEMSVTDVIESWNDVCGSEGLPKITERGAKNPTLRKEIALRLREQPELKFWETVLNRCWKSPFLRGEGGSWKVTLRWLVDNDYNALKVYEGHYNGKN